MILIGATNRSEVLDPALLRPGRFDRQVLVDRPDRSGRLQILKVHVAKIRLADGVDLDQIAGLTTGFTGADLANLVNEAAIVATRRTADAVTLDDFTAAIERIVAGLEKKSRVLGPAERSRVAHHEMGHALVAATLPGVDPVHKVSIIPRGVGALGFTMQRPTEDRFLLGRRELENRIAVLMGGRAAAVWVERLSRTTRNALGFFEVDIDEFAHAKGEVVSGATISDLDPAPRAMGVKEDEEIDGAVAAILVIETFGPSRRGRDRLARFADELGGAFVEADHWSLRIGLLDIEAEHILHAGDVLGVDLGDAPHVLLPGLEMVLGQASADGLTRETVMVGLLRHPRQHRAIALAAVAPHDRAQRGVGLHRRAVDADPLALHKAALGHEPQHPAEHGLVRLVRQT